MAYSPKPLHSWLSDLTCSMTRLKGFRMIKFRLVKNPRWLPMLKIAKPVTFSPEWHGIFGWYFVWSINGTLLLRIIKLKKNGCRIRSQWPTSCLQVQFYRNANISITKNREKYKIHIILWTIKWILTKYVFTPLLMCRCNIAFRGILPIHLKVNRFTVLFSPPFLQRETDLWVPKDEIVTGKGSAFLHGETVCN